MRTETRYVVLRAPTFTGRIVRRAPRNLRRDEVAYRLVLNIPDGWGTIGDTLNVELPAPPTHGPLREGVVGNQG